MGMGVIVILVLLAVNLILAYFMNEAAAAKGYDGKAHAFGMCFWLGILGCLYVVALPDLVQREELRKLREELRVKDGREPAQKELAEELPEL